MVLVGIQALFFYKDGKVRKDNFKVKSYLTLCCIELIILAGVRGYTIGADTKTYLNAVDYYGGMSVSKLLDAKIVYPYNFEIGYFWLTKICCLLGLGKTGFLFVVAIIIYLPIFSMIKKHSSVPYLSILCYFAFGFFSYSLGIFRQMIAVSILIQGWDCIVERNFIKYLMYVIFAMTFHITALVAIILYFLYGINWQRIIIWCVPFECVLLIFGRHIVLFLIRMFPWYSGYIGGKHDVQGGSYLMLILLNVVFWSIIFLQQKENNVCKDMTVCALFLAICIQCLGYSFGLLGRAVSYFSIYLVLAIPNVIYSIGIRLEYGLRETVSLVAILCLFILAFLSFNGNQYVVPYYTIFN